MTGNAWFSRLFGDTAAFALRVALTSGPRGELAWGGLEIWTAGACLTRATHRHDETTTQAVVGDLAEILAWFSRVGARLLNEEALPFPPKDLVADASDWFSRTEDCPAGHQVRRSVWREAHGLRRASLAMALPNVSFRRSGDEVEVSWDNDAWGASHPGVRYAEPRGAVAVPGPSVAAAIEEALRTVHEAIVQRFGQPPDFDRTVRPGDPPWRWLVPTETFDVVDEHHRAAFDAEFATTSGAFLTHSEATRILARARAGSADEVRAMLDAARLPERPMSERLRALVRPSRASRRPWDEGYEAAEEIREALCWGDAPAPALDAWLRAEEVELRPPPPRGVVVVARRSSALGGAVAVDDDGAGVGTPSFHYATALGHLLLDRDGLAIDGIAERSLSSARARAFAAMFLLPDGAARAAAEKGSLDADDVRALASRSSLGIRATLWHLENRGFLTAQRHVELEGQIVRFV